MSTEERANEARAAIEEAVEKFVDVWVDNEGSDLQSQMPLLGHWTFIVTYDDALDPSILSSYRISRRNQATHETAGLLWLALQEIGHPPRDE